MKKTLKSLFLLLALLLVLSACSGPAKLSVPEEPLNNATSETETTPESMSSKQQTVIDVSGREVIIPEKIETIVITCYGGASQEVTVLGGASRLVAQPKVNSKLLLKMYPDYAKHLDSGSFDDINVEEIISIQPDIVFVAAHSIKGNEQLENLGLVTYEMATAKADVESLKTEFLNVGKILGTEAKAQKLVDFWNDRMARLEAALAKVPENERKKVFRASKNITTANHTVWAGNWIRTAGGVTDTEDGITGDVSVEQLMGWNPDIIIVSSGTDIDAILKDERIQGITAVKNGAVYSSPQGAMGWDVPSPEVPLGFMWFAKVLYPEYMAEFDIEAETREFYKTFYEYELMDEDYSAMMAGTNFNED